MSESEADKLSFKWLVAALPQANRCERCGLVSPFTRQVAYVHSDLIAEGRTEHAALCFWCYGPSEDEMDALPPSLRLSRQRGKKTVTIAFGGRVNWGALVSLNYRL